MNWGNKLILVFVAFGSFMSFMVYRCMKSPVNLVAKEYYRDEIAYQQVIDSRENTAALSSKVKLAQSNDSISIWLPEEMKDRPVTGNILFYCAADASRDRQLPLQVNANALQQLSVKTFVPGNYLVKISWEASDMHYYSEEPLIIH